MFTDYRVCVHSSDWLENLDEIFVESSRFFSGILRSTENFRSLKFQRLAIPMRDKFYWSFDEITPGSVLDKSSTSKVEDFRRKAQLCHL